MPINITLVEVGFDEEGSTRFSYHMLACKKGYTMVSEMPNFEELAELLKTDYFARRDRLPFKGSTWRGADLIVISNDPETVDLYKNHHQLHWANAGDFVLKTAFSRAIDKMLREFRDVIKPHAFMNKHDFYPEIARAIARTELRENVTWADIVDAAVGCAELLWEECVAMNKSPEEIGSTYWIKDNDIVIDIETSSLSETEGDIIVLHAVRLSKGNSEPLRIEMLFRPESPLTESVQEMTGIKNSILEKQPLFRETAADFISFIGNSLLVCANAEFDLKFINTALQKAGYAQLNPTRFYDVLPLVPQQYRSRGTAGIIEYAGKDPSWDKGINVDIIEAIYLKAAAL